MKKQLTNFLKLLITTIILSNNLTAQNLIERSPFIIAPTIEGLLLCDEVNTDLKFNDFETALAYCEKNRLSNEKAISNLLDTLEPGGAKGKVQVGYTITIQLLSLYKQEKNEWIPDDIKINSYLKLIKKINRPVVIYLASNHFDTIAPLAKLLAKNPRNLMKFADGSSEISGYFGYSIVPFTLLENPEIPINKYRFSMIRHVSKKINALPKASRDNIIAITLAGELHHMFPNFEAGMGVYNDIKVTDYSEESIANFQNWLLKKYTSIEKYNAATGFNFSDFKKIPAPAKDIRKDNLNGFYEHYDSFADGTLPISGWLSDPEQKISQLNLYVDGKFIAKMNTGLNRLDVYRAVDNINTPNVGFRYDFIHKDLAPGYHLAQIIAQSNNKEYLLNELEFIVSHRDQREIKKEKIKKYTAYLDIKKIKNIRFWVDLPKSLQDVYYNPLALDWNLYREQQVKNFLFAFYNVAKEAGLPANKLYSHQIIAQVNSTWNPQLFAANATFDFDTPWLKGINMYGGSTDSQWLRAYLKSKNIVDYAAPEYHPQQWKNSSVHLDSLRLHYNSNARFISPYYFSIIPDRFKATTESGVNRMELRADNNKDGSDQFYKAIQEFAKN